jgi:hypothetical protein
MNEFGYEQNPTEEIEEGLETRAEDKETDPDLENLIALYSEQCSHVLSDPDTRASLKELFDDAREFIDVNNKAEWLKLLKQTKGALENEEDFETISEILREAKTEGMQLQE